MKALHLLGLCLLMLAGGALANDAPLHFDTQQQHVRYKHLIQELRCLVCQNETLADSTADLAQDLRQEVYQQIMSGKDDKAIIGYLTARYGDFVLYRPPLKRSTWLLWFGPFVVLLLGLFILLRILRQAPRTVREDLTDEERAKLRKLLQDEEQRP